MTEEDFLKIKYLRIGESMYNDFIIEMSTACPPEPFVATDGGDEWGAACVRAEEISGFIDKQRESNLQLSLFCYDFTENEYAWSDETSKKWEEFKKTIIWYSHYKEVRPAMLLVRLTFEERVLPKTIFSEYEFMTIEQFLDWYKKLEQ